MMLFLLPLVMWSAEVQVRFQVSGPENAGRSKVGDVVQCKADGPDNLVEVEGEPLPQWGRREHWPRYLIIRFEGLSVEECQDLIEPDQTTVPDPDGDATLIDEQLGYRSYFFDMSGINQGMINRTERGQVIIIQWNQGQRNKFTHRRLGTTIPPTVVTPE
jgi:hypothetical protein